MMKNIIRTFATLTITLLLTFAANAQPGGGGTGGFDDEPQDVPVDGGVVLLALAGAAYGYRKLKK